MIELGTVNSSRSSDRDEGPFDAVAHYEKKRRQSNALVLKLFNLDEPGPNNVLYNSS